MDKRESLTEKQWRYCLGRKFRRILNSIADEHTLIASLIVTTYIVSKLNIWIINDYFFNFIISFVIVFVICDNTIHLLIDLLRKTTRIEENTTDDNRLSHNITEVR